MKVVSSARIKRSLQHEMRGKYPDVHFVFCVSIDEAERDLEDADVLITYGSHLQAKHIVMANRLKWIMVISAGIDRLPREEIEKRQIIVTNARGIHGVPMAEYTISMMLNVARNEKKLFHNEQNKIWDQRVKISEITGKTIAVLGTGAIGKEIARLAKAFRMKTLGYNRSGKKSEEFDEIYTYNQLMEILARADFVVSVLPSTEDTKNLITINHFQAMKKEAVFINIGRGSTVCEDDLVAALRKEMIAHAVLDVFQKEPLDRDHPFWEMENVTVTPHLSGVFPEYQPRAFKIFEHNLRVFLNGEGELINKVDLKRGY